MSHAFTDNTPITLKPGDATVPYSFTFSAATSATSNDGSLPTGTTISSASLVVYDSGGTDRTSEIIVAESNTTTVCSVTMKYPATTGAGQYMLKFLLTLSSGAVLEFWFDKIFAEAT